MSKKKFTTKSALLLAAAVVLIGAGSIGTTRALPSASSENHEVNAVTNNIAVEIYENGSEKAVKENTLSLDVVGDKLLLGKKYNEQVNVANTGDIDAYLRVTVKKYWLDGSDKRVDLDPDTIGLVFDEKWNATSETAERTVLYYPTVVKAHSKQIPVITSMTIDESVATNVTKVTEGNTVKTVFAYDDLKLVIDVTADVVQTHNADAAIKSVWGVDADSVGISGTK